MAMFRKGFLSEYQLRLHLRLVHGLARWGEARGEGRREGGARGEEERPGKFERHSDAQVRGRRGGDVTCPGSVAGPQPAPAGPRDREAAAHGRLGDTAPQVGPGPGHHTCH